MSRHVIVVAIGSAGDVHPLAALALALQQRGARVSLLASAPFAGLAARLGLHFVAMGSEQDYQQAMQDPDLWHPRRGLKTVWRYASQAVSASHDWIAEHAEADTVLVGSTLAFGARIAHDTLGLPMVSVHLAPAVLMSAQDPPRFAAWALPRGLPARWVSALWSLVEMLQLDPVLAPTINALRRRHGLAPVHHIMRRYMHAPQRVLLFYPEWFAPDPGDRPAHCRSLGFPRFDEQGLHAWPEGLGAFLAAGTAPLLFTPGSAMQHAHGFFERAVATCRALGRRGIIVTRWQQQVPPLPDSMLRLDYVPFSELLPHVALIAHHGGIGTCAQALAAGVPQLVVPNAHDQFDNGARLQRLGVGDWLPQNSALPRFQAAVQQLLQSQAVQQACRHWQAQLQDPADVLASACSDILSLGRH